MCAQSLIPVLLLNPKLQHHDCGPALFSFDILHHLVPPQVPGWYLGSYWPITSRPPQPWARGGIRVNRLHLKSCFKRVQVLETSLRLCLSAELHVQRGFEKPRVAVFLHKRVDLALGQIEAWHCGLLHVLLGDAFCLVIKIHLRYKWWRRN